VSRLLLALNASLNVTDNDGNTAAHHAIVSQNFAALQVLVEADANTDIKNKEGYTPEGLHQHLCTTEQKEQRRPNAIYHIIPHAEKSGIKSYLQSPKNYRPVVLMIPAVFLAGMAYAVTVMVNDWLTGFGIVLAVLFLLTVVSNQLPKRAWEDMAD
jgi:hypothetical protein